MRAWVATGIVDRHWVLAPLAIAFAAAIVFGGAYVQRPPIDVLESSVTPEVEQGGFIVVERTVKWHRSDCRSFTTQAEFIDSLKPPRAHANPVPQRYGDLYGRSHFQTEWQVAFTMPWGPATFHNRLSFDCFPFYGLMPVVVDLPELRFHVSPP